MKKLGKKLVLNKKTIDILDDKALRNVKGGVVGGDTCYMWSCIPHSELCEPKEETC